MAGAATQTERASAALALLHRIAAEDGPAAFACSFGVEDMVLFDLIARHRLPITILTLDTGRLPEETHALIERACARYRVRVDVLLPDAKAVESLIAAHGVNGFYRSVEVRKACCRVRKVEALARALAEKRAWITGLRREQSADRGGVDVEAFDDVHGLRKFNPLAWWTHADVWAYVRRHDVPYNALHDRGYPSIGCTPCTRAVDEGADPRSGRWWWEAGERKECGLHPRVVPVRTAPAEAIAAEAAR
jgi:phosphoadenosine phosphosulfate reductase